MNIKELLGELYAHPSHYTVALKNESKISHWGDIASYRGYYAEVAVDEGYKAKSVSEVTSDLLGVIGRTFGGYKGGEYTMSKFTNVYFATWGNLGPVTSRAYVDDETVFIVCLEEGDF